MSAEYEAIKKALLKQHPDWEDSKNTEVASKIFYKLYNITPNKAEALDSKGSWRPKKQQHETERSRVIQKIVVDRNKYQSISSAKNYLANQGFVTSNMDYDGESYSFKQRNMIMFDKKSLVTLPIGEGMKAIFGIYNNAVKSENSALVESDGVIELYPVPEGIKEGQDVWIDNDVILLQAPVPVVKKDNVSTSTLPAEVSTATRKKVKKIIKSTYKPKDVLMIIPSEKKNTQFTLQQHSNGMFKDLRYKLGDDCIRWRIHDIKNKKMASMFTNEPGMQGASVPTDEGRRDEGSTMDAYIYVDNNSKTVKVQTYDRGQVEFGAQGKDFHEYFLYGKAHTGRYMAKKSYGGVWEIHKPYDQTPYILGEGTKEGWLPEPGTSALPKEWKDKIPKKLRWWDGKPKSNDLIRDMIVDASQYLASKQKLSSLISKQPMSSFINKSNLSVSLKMLSLSTNTNAPVNKLRKKLGLMKFVKFSMSIKAQKQADIPTHGSKLPGFESVSRNKFPDNGVIPEGFELPLPVEGVAFEPGVHHGVNYPAEVVEESAHALKYQRILLNKKNIKEHGQTFLDVSGFITDEVWWDAEAQQLKYSGLIYDYETAAAVWNGELSKVSAGVWEMDNNAKPTPTANRMIYDELSILLFPEVKNASIKSHNT